MAGIQKATIANNKNYTNNLYSHKVADKTIKTLFNESVTIELHNKACFVEEESNLTATKDKAITTVVNLIFDIFSCCPLIIYILILMWMFYLGMK